MTATLLSKPLVQSHVLLLVTVQLVLCFGLLIGLMPVSAQEDASVSPEDTLATEADNEEESARLYRTNAERRETGLKHRVTPWLTLSGLLELEAAHEEFTLKTSGDRDRQSESSTSFQLGIEATPWESIKGELLLEYDTDIKQLEIDEALVALEYAPWELEIGKLYTPFGTYISQFASGPILEIGETRATGAMFIYTPGDELEISLMVYRGRAKSLESEPNKWDWALGWEVWPTQHLFLGMSFQSDLADSESRILDEEDNRFIRKVSGVSGYILWTSTDIDISFEILGATNSFRELDSDQDKPFAWNMEFTHFLSSQLQWAIRLEGSQEIEDEPELQTGVALTWRAEQNMSITLEYLLGKYANGMATNDQDEPYDRVDHLGALLSIAF